MQPSENWSVRGSYSLLQEDLSEAMRVVGPLARFSGQLQRASNLETRGDFIWQDSDLPGGRH